MVAFPALNNNAALTLLRGATSSSAAPSQPLQRGAQSAALQILSSINGGTTASDPLQQAANTISRIIREGGGEIITAGVGASATGTDGDDIMYGMFDVSLSGGDGDDQLYAFARAHLSGGAGNDRLGAHSDSVLDGGDGDDHIGGGRDNQITGGNGDDTILIVGNGNIVDGGSGSDFIDVISNGENGITGGEGDDSFLIHGHEGIESGTGPTLNYAAGDGKDSITFTKGHATLQLSEDFNAENTEIVIENNKAVISFKGNDNDRIEVNFELDVGSLTLAFADGTTTEIKTEGPTRREQLNAWLYQEH